MGYSLDSLIENLYETFDSYKVDDLEKCGCFDYGPTIEEISVIR